MLTFLCRLDKLLVFQVQHDDARNSPSNTRLLDLLKSSARKIEYCIQQPHKCLFTFPVRSWRRIGMHTLKNVRGVFFIKHSQRPLLVQKHKYRSWGNYHAKNYFLTLNENSCLKQSHAMGKQNRLE